MTRAEKIRYYRKQAGLTQKDVADKLGIQPQAVYKYEKGIVTNIPLSHVEKMADMFGINPNDIIGWDEKTQSIPVKVESIDDFENIAIALEAAGAYEEANRVRKDKAENEQMITFIKLFQGLSPENKLEILAKMVMMGARQ